jgi:hypothetical protein
MSDLPMTVEEARAVDKEIRACLAYLRDCLERLYREEAWEALGYSSWEELVWIEFLPGMAPMIQDLLFGKGVEQWYREKESWTTTPLP